MGPGCSVPLGHVCVPVLAALTPTIPSSQAPAFQVVFSVVWSKEEK